MFQAGMSIAKIATIRGLSVGTIEGHLARYLPSGQVKLEDIVAAEKIPVIEHAIDQIGLLNGLGQIKEFLGDEFSYGEIRAVLAAR
jgi:uncharacterized protein YpbB